ncbi:MAG: hypothetical protein ACXVLQ_08465 [Bacteriovorax sp.]
MSEQQSSGNRPQNNTSGSNSSRRHHHNRRRPHSPGNAQQAPGPQRPGGAPREAQGGGTASGAEASGGGNRRHRGRHHQNRPRNPHSAPQHLGGPGATNIERIYEKYLNLLDQHLMARRKYHDLFYRADPAQKNKLERNFYNTLNDVREYESKLTPEARELFEKRNNGLSLDTIYTTNHEISESGENPPPETEWKDPHFLQSQQAANYADDTEESVGSLDDYLKYKNLI